MRLAFRTLAAAGLLLVLGVPRPSRADVLIQIPTADRPVETRGEYKERLEGRDERYGTLVAPAGSAYELMARYYDRGGVQRLEGGGSLQLLPDGLVTPGIALGLWDFTNSSPLGRRAFLVFTKSLRAGQFGIPKALDRLQLTFGTGTGKFSGVLAGLRMDLPAHLSLVAEYDARRLNAGLWFTPIRPLTLKAELQNGNLFVGGDLRARF
jgi:hypothetical protein